MKAEDKKKIPFLNWMAQVKKEQKKYPALKGKILSPTSLIIMHEQGKTPIEALNDLITLT